MKRFLPFFAALLLSLFPINATAPNLDGDENDPEIVDVVQQQNNGEDPSSNSATYVRAYKTSSSLTVQIENFTGNAVVSVIGIGGYIVSDNNPIVGSGIVVLDISSLPSGQYTLFIQANHIFQGFFTR